MIRFNKKLNKKLSYAVLEARKAQIPNNYIERVIHLAKLGFKSIEFPIYDTDWNSEAYATVSGQNSNNSVRVTNEFMTRSSYMMAIGIFTGEPKKEKRKKKKEILKHAKL